MLVDKQKKLNLKKKYIYSSSFVNSSNNQSQAQTFPPYFGPYIVDIKKPQMYNSKQPFNCIVH